MLHLVAEMTEIAISKDIGKLSGMFLYTFVTNLYTLVLHLRVKSISKKGSGRREHVPGLDTPASEMLFAFWALVPPSVQMCLGLGLLRSLSSELSTASPHKTQPQRHPVPIALAKVLGF